MDAYRHVPCGDFCEYYDMLAGPDGFECLLTEPEDRNWYRDGRAVVDRLNAQHAELAALRAEVERLRRALAGAVPWIGEHAEGPAWASDEAKRENRQMCEAAFDAACNALQPLPAPPKEEE